MLAKMIYFHIKGQQNVFLKKEEGFYVSCLCIIKHAIVLHTMNTYKIETKTKNLHCIHISKTPRKVMTLLNVLT